MGCLKSSLKGIERYQPLKNWHTRAKNGMNKAMGLEISNLDVGMQ